ncbi:MAG: efflux RND transporter periplasmic adaptor subunit [Clostridia bacterium]|jgi:HlyD family secretion protein|nr:efflux RND transporter periplasmic adaptor subunit [Clostridia bacterium]
MLNIKLPKLSGLLKKKWFLAFIALIVIVAAVFAGLHFKSNQANAAQHFLTSPARTGNVEYSIDGSGSLQPSERYALKTWSGGTVTEIFVTEGTRVTKGQPLMTVKNDSLNSTAKQADLEWSIAQSALEDMYNPPGKDDFARRAAELKVEQYQLALEDSKEERDKLTVRAPFDGTLIDLADQVILGQKINSGVTAATFATSGQIEAVASFDAEALQLIRPGQEASVYLKSLNVFYTGVVKEVDFIADSSSGTFEVIITLNNPDNTLRAGMQTNNTVIIARDDDNNLLVYRNGSGSLRYARSENLVTEVSGAVAEIYHQEGDVIQKGEPLFRLTNDDYNRKVKEAEVQLGNAEEELRKLLSPDADTIQSQELKAEQAYQKVVKAQDNLNSLNVVSPIDGIVTGISVSVGDELGEDTSSSGQELIVVCNFDKNYLQISVDELDINKIDFGQTATVSIDALPEAQASGTVTGIAQEGVSSSGVTTYPVTLEVGYVDGIKGGMSATATIIINKKENVLTVPAEALISNNGRQLVRVLENGQPVARPVKVGINDGTRAEIIEGLQEGDQVVVVSKGGSAQQFGGPTMIRVPGGMGSPPQGGGGGGTVRIQR